MIESHNLTDKSRNYSYADDNQIITVGDIWEEVVEESNKAAQAFATMCRSLKFQLTTQSHL